MSQITERPRTLFPIALLFGCLLGLGGCGDATSKSDLDPETGMHPSGWLPAGHAGAGQSHLTTCQPCHGDDFHGGIAKVSCLLCHLGDQTHVHPLSWDDLVYALHGPYVDQNGTAACANAFCHGADLQGVAQSGPSCTSCHIGGPTAIHPWTAATDFSVSPPQHAQYLAAHGGSTHSCRNDTCHGANLQGVFLSGPPCSECHPGESFPP